MNIFEAIRRDHEVQRNLLDKLVKTEGDTEERKRIYLEAKHQLISHESAEERYFYKILMDSDLTLELSRHGVAEHHEIDEMVEKIDNTEMSSSAWLVYAKQLKEIVEHHLDEEEHEFFQMAGKVLTEKQKTELVAPYDEMMQQTYLD